MQITKSNNEEKLVPIWKALFMSFYSRYLYIDVARNWRGFGIKYLLALSSFMCIVMVFTWLNTLYRIDVTKIADDVTKTLFEAPDLTFEESLNRVLNIVSQIPQVTIRNGEASIEGNAPSFIKDPIILKDIAIIDVTGKYTSLDNEDANILITKNSIIFKNEDGEQELFYLSSLGKKTNIDEDDLNKLFDVFAQIPLITVENGQASISEKNPYYIYSKDDKVLAIIDVEGTTTSLEDSDAYLLLTKDKILIKNALSSDNTEVMLSELNADKIFDALEHSLILLRKMFTWILFLFVTPVFIVSTAFALFFLVCIYSVVGLSVSMFAKLAKVNFSVMLRLCSVAITPVVVLNMLIPQVFANQGLIYFLIALGYVYFALKANSEVPNEPDKERR
ncbi:MAG: hypothetical protein K0R98_624 [Rickettsiaceae bacterium]|jgi:hypothetical protein|nr:hypothetical protein [Rickettsiaceae bacterium]